MLVVLFDRVLNVFAAVGREIRDVAVSLDGYSLICVSRQGHDVPIPPVPQIIDRLPHRLTRFVISCRLSLPLFPGYFYWLGLWYVRRHPDDFVTVVGKSFFKVINHEDRTVHFAPADESELELVGAGNQQTVTFLFKLSFIKKDDKVALAVILDNQSAPVLF